MRILFLIVLFSINLVSFAQEERYSVPAGETLIDGYDPVSYFDGTPLKGASSIFVDIEGRKLVFSSEENKTRYLADPERFFPQYGGWCAIAMVDDTFVIPNYKFYKIQEDRLYFFRVQAFFNGLVQWNRSPENNQMKADANYQMHF